MPLKHAQEVIDELAREIERYPYGTHASVTVLRFGLLVDAHEALVFAIDEMRQAQEDRTEAIHMGIRLAHRIVDLEETIAVMDDLMHSAVLAGAGA